MGCGPTTGRSPTGYAPFSRIYATFSSRPITEVHAPFESAYDRHVGKSSLSACYALNGPTGFAYFADIRALMVIA